MADEIRCPRCLKMNGIQKFCIYCGERLLLDDDQIKLMLDEPEATCLNCGRPVKKGQTRCDCGYEVRSVKCPKCEAINEYTNRFCTSCGEKLWRSDVYDYKYDESHFEHHLFKKGLPHKLRNTSVFKRYKSDFLIPAPGDARYEGGLEKLQSLDSKSVDALCEIRSRWKVVSPNYCINCLGVIKQEEYSCPKCGSDFSGDKKRVEQLQSGKDNYAEPIFDIADFKFTFRFTELYLGSLAPSIGESQFEYRERLKWEFAENTILKNNIKKAIGLELAPKPDFKPIPSKRKMENGGYCDHNCRHFYEEYLDEDGAPTAEITANSDGYCNLGYSIGGFCEHYEY